MTHPAVTPENTRAGILAGISAYVIWGLVPIFFKQIAEVPAVDVEHFAGGGGEPVAQQEPGAQDSRQWQADGGRDDGGNQFQAQHQHQVRDEYHQGCGPGQFRLGAGVPCKDHGGGRAGDKAPEEADQRSTMVSTGNAQRSITSK